MIGLSARALSVGFVRIFNGVGTCTPTPLMSTSAMLLSRRLSTSSSLVSTVNTTLSTRALRIGSLACCHCVLRTSVRLLPGGYAANLYGPSDTGWKVYFAPPLAPWSYAIGTGVLLGARRVVVVTVADGDQVEGAAGGGPRVAHAVDPRVEPRPGVAVRVRAPPLPLPPQPATTAMTATSAANLDVVRRLMTRPPQIRFGRTVSRQIRHQEDRDGSCRRTVTAALSRVHRAVT